MANIFNAAQYLELYPAIAEYGYNEANAWDHFVQYGAAELRTPNDELEGKVYAESVLNYANGNPELAEYFGVVVPAESLTAAQQADLLLHYVQYGNAEERENKIIDAPVQGEDSDLSDLRDALETVVAADADVKEAVDAAVKGLKITEEVIADKGSKAEAVAAAYEDAAKVIDDEGAPNPDIAIPGFAAVTDAAVRTQLIEAKQAQLANAEQVAAKALGANKAKVDAYLAAQARVENLEGRLETAETNAHNAATLASAQLTVDVNDPDADENVPVEVNFVEASIILGEGESGKHEVTEAARFEIVHDEATVYLTVNSNNQPVFTTADGEAVTDATAKELVSLVKASSSYSSLAQSVQQTNALAQQSATAENRADDAFDAVPEGLTAGTELAGAAKDYETAKNNVKEFADNVAEFRKTEAYQNAIEEATAAHKAAVEALEELGYEINDTGFGTPENDLFVYGNDDDTVFEFGAEGEDLFFFGDFAFVELKANDKFAEGNFGDRNTLEIFAQQQGTDVVLYVEINEVGGNAFGIDDNVNTITLVGVNLEDLSFDSGAGFLVA